VKNNLLKGGIMVKFKKTDIISYVLENHPKAEEILTGFGLHCIFCPVSQMESLEEACEVHGLDVNELLKALNK
jgi:hydroxylamine reductase